jgi:hypothetical protein
MRTPHQGISHPDRTRVQGHTELKIHIIDGVTFGIVERKQGMTFIPELATNHLPSEPEEMIKHIVGTEPVCKISLFFRSLYS